MMGKLLSVVRINRNYYDSWREPKFVWTEVDATIVGDFAIYESIREENESGWENREWSLYYIPAHRLVCFGPTSPVLQGVAIKLGEIEIPLIEGSIDGFPVRDLVDDEVIGRIKDILKEENPLVYMSA